MTAFALLCGVLMGKPRPAKAGAVVLTWCGCWWPWLARAVIECGPVPCASDGRAAFCAGLALLSATAASAGVWMGGRCGVDLVRLLVAMACPVT